MHICNMKALPLLVRELWPRLKFFKSRSNFKVKVTRSKFWHPLKGLVTMNTHVKYESSTYSSSRVIGKVKVFCACGRAHARRGYDNSSTDFRLGELKISTWYKKHEIKRREQKTVYSSQNYFHNTMNSALKMLYESIMNFFSHVYPNVHIS